MSHDFEGLGFKFLDRLKQRHVFRVTAAYLGLAEERLRIAAQLINVADGFHLWSQTFDRKLEDVFAVQEEIARQVVAALRVNLLASAASRLERRGTKNAAAYEHYLRGRQLLNKEKEAEQRAAVELFRQAIRLDPSFADAHAGLADVLTQLLRQRQNVPGLPVASMSSQPSITSWRSSSGPMTIARSLWHCRSTKRRRTRRESRVRCAVRGRRSSGISPSTRTTLTRATMRLACPCCSAGETRRTACWTVRWIFSTAPSPRVAAIASGSSTTTISHRCETILGSNRSLQGWSNDAN